MKEHEKYGFKSQIQLFKHCWNTRKHKCFVTNQRLDRFNGSGLFMSVFAHVLRKSAYPEWRLNPNNIVLLSPNFEQYSIHRLYDDGVFSEIKKFENITGKSFQILFEFERQSLLQYSLETNKAVQERRIVGKYLD